MTVNQFNELERLLPKKKAFAELARMTLKVVSDKVVLKVDAKAGQTTELAAHVLSCEERQKKVKTLMKDLQNQLE